MTDVEVRPYDPADFDAVALIWTESWQSTGLAAGSGGDLAFHRQRLPQEIARGWSIHVARCAGVVVGFLAFHQGKLEQLWIAPSMQGRGIGKLLLDFAKAQMLEGFWLTTQAANLGACRFYEREGLVRGPVSAHPRSGRPIVRFDWRQWA